MGTRGKRPTAITVIGWLFIVGASMSVVSAGMGLFAFLAMQSMGGIPPMPATVPGPLRVLGVVVQYFGVIAVVQVGIALLVLTAAIQFLRLRAWARTALEAICWLTLVYVVGFGILWTVVWVTMSSGIPGGDMPAGVPGGFTGFGVAIGLIVFAVSAVPMVILLKFLRGGHVRQAMASAQAPAEDVPSR